MKKNIATLVLLVMTPLSALASGSCAYTAYKNCYHQKPFTKLGVRAVCLVSSSVSDGVYDTENLSGCVDGAKEYGQYVVVTYTDFATARKITTRVYRDFK